MAMQIINQTETQQLARWETACVRAANHYCVGDDGFLSRDELANAARIGALTGIRQAKSRGLTCGRKKAIIRNHIMWAIRKMIREELNLIQLPTGASTKLSAIRDFIAKAEADGGAPTAAELNQRFGVGFAAAALFAADANVASLTDSGATDADAFGADTDSPTAIDEAIAAQDRARLESLMATRLTARDRDHLTAWYFGSEATRRAYCDSHGLSRDRLMWRAVKVRDKLRRLAA